MRGPRGWRGRVMAGVRCRSARVLRITEIHCSRVGSAVRTFPVRVRARLNPHSGPVSARARPASGPTKPSASSTIPIPATAANSASAGQLGPVSAAAADCPSNQPGSAPHSRGIPLRAKSKKPTNSNCNSGDSLLNSVSVTSGEISKLSPELNSPRLHSTAGGGLKDYSKKRSSF